MAQVKGIDFIVKINTGSAESPVWTKVAGQKGATLNQSADTLEVTSKDSNGYKEFEAGFKEWSIEADGLLVINDEGFSALEEAFIAGEKVLVQLATASGESYKGLTIITDLPLEMAYDDMVSYSVTFQGTGALTKGE